MEPTSPLLVVKEVRDAVREAMRGWSAEERERFLVMEDYHGFGKCRLPTDILNPILSRFECTDESMQVEIVRVSSDLTSEVHYHEGAYAAITVLGEAEGVPSPRLASAYLKDRWFAIKEGDQLDIPSGVGHGFTVQEGGLLYFLSVQTPPIVGKDGHDDYHKIRLL